MRIHIYLKDFPRNPAGQAGGTQKAVAGLAGGFAACGARVTVLGETDTDSITQAEGGYEVRTFRHDVRLLRRARLAPAFKQYVREQINGGLVIINAIFHPSCYRLSRLLRSRGVPYAIAPHDPYHPSIFSSNPHIKWPYWHLFEKRMLKQAMAVQVLDPRHEKYIRDLGVKTPVVPVINGLDSNDIPAEDALRWPADGPVRLLFLGRLDAHNKALDLLIDAVAGLPDKTVMLTLRGPDFGDNAALNARITRHGLGDRVRVVGPDFSRTSSQITADSDIVCLPSRFEGFGLSALEAMLAGRVVLVSDVAGIAPYVGAADCGVVIPSTTEGIRDGLGRLLDARSRWREMGLAGRSHALRHLQWKSIARDALDRYSVILASNSPVPFTA